MSHQPFIDHARQYASLLAERNKIDMQIDSLEREKIKVSNGLIVLLEQLAGSVGRNVPKKVFQVDASLILLVEYHNKDNVTIDLLSIIVE